MRTYTLYRLLVILFLLGSIIPLKARITLDYYEANKTNNAVLLKWAISHGQTCNGITITRSSDSLYFEPIGRIEGVCGSPDASIPYSFIDETPLKNQINYYKLELGVSSFSPIISFNYIDISKQNYQLWPNPAQDQTSIHFENPNFELFQLIIFDSFGRKIEELETKNSFFNLSTSNYPSGIYVFQLISINVKTMGKFMVTH